METEERDDTLKGAADIKEDVEEDVNSGHTCGVCGRTFPLLSSLSQHMRRHTREKPYKCPYCDHRTAQKGRLKAHIRSHKLGLLSQNLSEKEAKEEEADAQVTLEHDPESISTDKHQAVNGKVKKKVTKNEVQSKATVTSVEVDPKADAGPFTCTICSQVFPQELLLKAHMKRHRSTKDHGCRICGRRFRQAWFLQSHMRIHRMKGQLKDGKGNDLPITINGVLQDPASLINEECLYELCVICGNFFPDRVALQTHEDLHNSNSDHSFVQKQTQNENQETEITQDLFLEGLNLRSVRPRSTQEDQRPGRRIVELDPICSYQAWQLVTRGRLMEASEKCLGWEERLADADVAYDTEKGEYIPLKRERKRKQMEITTSSVKKKKTDTSPGSGAQPKVAEKKTLQKDRIILNGLGHAFYEALQNRKVKEVIIPPKKSNKFHVKEETHFFCEHCHFTSNDASLLRSHLLLQHQDLLAPYSIHNLSLDLGPTGHKASKYMDYLRSRSVLLSQPYWSPYSCPPGQSPAEANIKTEKSTEPEDQVQGGTSWHSESLLNLSVSPVKTEDVSQRDSDKAGGLVRHQCPYCSHTSHYPEVLWIHQRVSHRVDSGSTLAPRWAPCASFKKVKAGGQKWRRTGPPSFLEGKDCPALPAPRAQRTQPPGSKSQSSSSVKLAAPKTQSLAPKSKQQSQSSDHSKCERPSQKKTGDPSPSSVGHSKAPSSSSSTVVNNSKSVSARTPASCPKNKGQRAAVEFPQEGLGFMLARSHSSASSNTDRPHPRRHSCDSATGAKGPDLWASMSTWGHKAYLEPMLFAQGKIESTGEMPVDIDIVSLFKNYSPHELAALYQQWGFIDPRLDPHAMVQLNGHFGNSSSEGSKQVSSRSTSSSGSLHKGT
ncbi:zinc finger protein 516-like [Synchiropus splendidus]|uniref:zinc finger protein 516-like n=1 Tax=Synchiropus splendidus TaxID=270530 RepID=UPI00237DD8EE|nr:zinc finger protein 516-like [Synchiropus splendidus]XP_053719056.1 zinc finger protein 516-like [Synchiropus splendidus]XP_053719057.1 zinc finger protein 516-like [Synchiropus splendidus]